MEMERQEKNERRERIKAAYSKGNREQGKHKILVLDFSNKNKEVNEKIKIFDAHLRRRKKGLCLSQEKQNLN
jgi:hypothetical protein